VCALLLLVMMKEFPLRLRNLQNSIRVVLRMGPDPHGRAMSAMGAMKEFHPPPPSPRGPTERESVEILMDTIHRLCTAD